MPEQNEMILPPFPSGWFVAALSENVKIGQIIEQKFCGEDVVIFRTASGKAVVMEAYCPHMGAHLGHGGKVEGEDIVCPFHGFCFNGSGECSKTGYGTPPPSQAKTKVWPVREQNGCILAYHNSDEGKSEPDWEIPVLDEEGWSEIRYHEWELKSNPQEISENSVDFGHFGLVHGYGDLKVIKELLTEGPLLTAKYGMSRIASFIGKGGKTVHVEFEIRQWGLGYAHVEARVIEYEMVSRHFVLVSPINGTDVFLRIGVSVKQDVKLSKISPLLGIFPKKLLFPLILRGYFKGYVHDVYDDFKIWENKKYVDPPLLAAGDGPIIKYRKWASRFHPESWKAAKAKLEEIESN
jgi:nitrite reductase/ring-hydroxylating ferredoxin subunit